MNQIQIDIQEKCIVFAIKVDTLKKQLQKQHREYNKSDQIDRSSSAIGAMYSEAVYAESELDYIHKLGIAQKECNETIYWLKVLFRCNYIDREVFDDLIRDVEELMRIITSLIISLKKHNA